MSTLLVIIGLATFATYVWMVVTAFGKSLGWGIAVMLFSPLAALIFAAMHFEEAKKPFAAFMACFLIYIFLVVQKASDFADDAGFTDMAAKIQRGEKISEEDMARNALRALAKMNEKGFVSDADLAKARADFAAKFPPREQVASLDDSRPSPKQKKPDPPGPATAASPTEPQRSAAKNPTAALDQDLELLIATDSAPLPGNTQTGFRKVYTEIDLTSLGSRIGKLAKITDRRDKQHIGWIQEVEAGRRIILQKSSGSVQYSLEILMQDIKSAMIQERVPY